MVGVIITGGMVMVGVGIIFTEMFGTETAGVTITGTVAIMDLIGVTDFMEVTMEVITEMVGIMVGAGMVGMAAAEI